MRIIALSIIALSQAGAPLCAQTADTDTKPPREAVRLIDPGDDFAGLHSQYLANEELQLERPVDTPEEPDISEGWRLPGWLTGFLSALGPLFQLIFYIGIGALIIAIGYYILTTVLGVRFGDLLNRKVKATPDGDDVLTSSLKPDAGTARSLLEEADALARQGKFADAIHLLLFRSIDDIQTRRKRRLSTSLTAREIGELDDLPPAPRRALHPIIRLVERSFFGAEPVGETDWQTARASYEAFAFGEAWT